MKLHRGDMKLHSGGEGLRCRRCCCTWIEADLRNPDSHYRWRGFCPLSEKAAMQIQLCTLTFTIGGQHISVQLRLEYVRTYVCTSHLGRTTWVKNKHYPHLRHTGCAPSFISEIHSFIIPSPLPCTGCNRFFMIDARTTHDFERACSIQFMPAGQLHLTATHTSSIRSACCRQDRVLYAAIFKADRLRTLRLCLALEHNPRIGMSTNQICHYQICSTFNALTLGWLL